MTRLADRHVFVTSEHVDRRCYPHCYLCRARVPRVFIGGCLLPKARKRGQPGGYKTVALCRACVVLFAVALEDMCRGANKEPGK